MLRHYMLFYGVYVGKVVGKATRECGCCMANVGIRCYVIFRETFTKWICKFVYYISLSRMTKYNKDTDKFISPDIKKIQINNIKIIYKNNNNNLLQILEVLTIKNLKNAIK